MKTLTIRSIGNISEVIIGASLQYVSSRIDADKTIIITDENVYRLYGDRFPQSRIIVIRTGESIKTFQTVTYILNKLLEYEADRSYFILGIGGGVVCDIAGFVASIFMRGVRFGFVSTTLLSQVDASIGGKNGINFNRFKNMVGVFSQPGFVICDTSLLTTLPPRELSSGFGEIVKHGAIANLDIITYLEENIKGALTLEPEIIEKLVYDSILIKAKIVSIDEREIGERRKLNFGHTFGHAIEITQGIPHGEAVSLGMILACELSLQKGLCSRRDCFRLKALLQKLKLPVKFCGDKEEVIRALRQDKKRSTDVISFVLLDSLGKAVAQDLDLTELADFIRKINEE